MARPARILLVAGARPNFMKVAPVLRALRESPDLWDCQLIHTGQHYDQAMSDVFFSDLGISAPDVHLNVGSGSHAQQTAAVMSAFDPVLERTPADLVVVVGDVNSTVACALVAAKRGVPVAHVEAGLRSGDRTMPEEINRVLTDQISDLLFTTEASALDNLVREGIPAARVHFVGNVMIDTLLAHRDRARALGTPSRLGLAAHGYAVLTLHRPSNVDDMAVFDRLMGALDAVSAEVPIVFPVHPRTRPAIDRSPVARTMAAEGRLQLLDPLGYLEFLGLVADAAAVLTDSGGVQEETTVLGVPCLTLRENTERPITLTSGTNQLVGTSPERIREGWRTLRSGAVTRGVPPLWDGGAARRIVDVLRTWRTALPARG
ncbi:MAG: UDP-N-acetylglucosamine 2-epimerase (non-hydrolyzing) [Vicinamibacterales bacterium]